MFYALGHCWRNHASHQTRRLGCTKSFGGCALHWPVEPIRYSYLYFECASMSRAPKHLCRQAFFSLSRSLNFEKTKKASSFSSVRDAGGEALSKGTRRVLTPRCALRVQLRFRAVWSRPVASHRSLGHRRLPTGF